VIEALLPRTTGLVSATSSIVITGVVVLVGLGGGAVAVEIDGDTALVAVGVSTVVGFCEESVGGTVGPARDVSDISGGGVSVALAAEGVINVAVSGAVSLVCGAG